jgi:transposase-like protein
MTSRYRYSDEFKHSVVQKFLTRGNRKVKDIADEAGIKTPSIYDWRDKFATSDDMKKPTKPQSRSASEKLKTLIEFDVLPIEKQGEYLRKNGLYIENIHEWRKQIEEALTPTKKSYEERKELNLEKNKIKQLDRIDEFSTDRLIELYSRLEPDLKLRVG